MELDDSVVHLKAGDVLAQRNTIHNWVNRGSEAGRGWRKGLALRGVVWRKFGKQSRISVRFILVTNVVVENLPTAFFATVTFPIHRTSRATDRFLIDPEILYVTCVYT
jgi:hypothetical protein